MISDQHTLEYEFDCLDIEVDGLRFAEVSGVAELAVNDHSDGSFYVKHITLRGERQVKIGPLLTLNRWEKSRTQLYRPSNDCRTFSAHLFRAIETALYRSRDAQEAWNSELEDAA